MCADFLARDFVCPARTERSLRALKFPRSPFDKGRPVPAGSTENRQLLQHSEKKLTGTMTVVAIWNKKEEL